MEAGISFFWTVMVLLFVLRRNVVLCSKEYSSYYNLEVNGSLINVKATERDEWNFFCFSGQESSLWRLWSSPVVKVLFENGTTPEYVYKQTGTYEELVERTENWNKFSTIYNNIVEFFGGKDFPEIPLPHAFNKSCLTVKCSSNYQVLFRIKAIEWRFVLYLLLGIGIFWNANSLSRNVVLHYGTGTALWVVGSILVLLFIVQRLFPQSIRKIFYLLFMFAGSATLYCWKLMMNFFGNTSEQNEHLKWFLCYLAISGIIGFCVAYKFGPVTDERSLNIIKAFTHATGLVLIYNGTQIRELSVAIMVIVCTMYLIPVKNIAKNRAFIYLRYRFCPPKIHMLTEEEYIMQANEETRKALEDLRTYCRSPQCDAWKTISRLNSPSRFASFVEGNSWHVTDEELLDYDSGPEPVQLRDSDLEDMEEIDYTLSSP